MPLLLSSPGDGSCCWSLLADGSARGDMDNAANARIPVTVAVVPFSCRLTAVGFIVAAAAAHCRCRCCCSFLKILAKCILVVVVLSSFHFVSIKECGCPWCCRCCCQCRHCSETVAAAAAAAAAQTLNHKCAPNPKAETWTLKPHAVNLESAETQVVQRKVILGWFRI